jgi:predicted ATPase/DNA-binding SARP family transcriptional activator
VLGPLEAVRDGATVALGGARPRAVLAALLLAGGRRVSMDALVDAVWGDAPPDTAVKTVQKYVSFLRARLDSPDLIASRADGYELVTDAVDARTLADLVARASAQPSPERAIAVLTEALDLWRGEPYADLPDLAAAQAERRRLAELQLVAIEALAEARLALGQHDRLVGWLEEQVSVHPLRERLWGALMLALYRGGRQAEALAAYQRLRTILIDELGVEPTPALRDLHGRILRQEDDDAPAGRTRGRPAAVLPLRLTGFVGREADLATLAGLIAVNRLVTLTGPAGSGKTRLAVELLAGSGPAGSWFVELAPITDPERIASAIAGTLRLAEQAGRDLAEIVADNLADKPALLVLDNCEHLLDGAAATVARLLAAAPQTRVLTTSRQPLGVPGEVVFEVPPLPVPVSDDPTEVADAAAVRLLAQRATAVDAGFAVTAANAAAVARIARRLDGMPLALELAAARLRVFDAGRLADLLDDRFRVLVSTLRTAPARHQTLRAAIAWSYDALDAEERTLFRALSVFEGGFTLEAADEVGGGAAVTLLPTLVERSLVVVDRGPGGTRYRLLETLREYGRAQLDPDESGALHRRHLDHYLALAEPAAAGLHGPSHRRWLEHLDPERDNIRAALRWSLTHGQRAAGLRLAVALANFWDEQGQYSEGTAWLRDALAASTDVPAGLRAAALAGAARLATGLGDHADAGRLAGQSLALAREAGDEPAVVHATALLGNIALYQGDYDEARPLLEESAAAFDRLGMRWALGEVLGRLGHMYRLRGDYDTARSYLERSRRIRDEVGDVGGQAWVLWQLGVLARYRAEYDRADLLYRQSLTMFEDMVDDAGAAHVRYSMGDLARINGDEALATSLYTESLNRLREHGDQRCVASILFNLGTLALDRADPEARALFARSLALRRQLHDQAGIAECLEAFAAVEEGAGEPVAAIRLLGAADALRDRTGAARPASDEDNRAVRVRALRESVGADAFASAWEAGRVEDCDTVAADLAAVPVAVGPP